MANEKPLRKIAEAFKELEAAMNSQTAEVEVAPFCQACSLVSPLIGCLGIAFKFAEMDYVSKVHDLAEASKSISTLQVLVDRDVEADCVRRVGSYSRNLLRVKRAIEVVKVLFENILVTKGKSLKDPASKAYQQVFAPHHGWVIRKAVAAGLYAFPTREQLLNKVNEDARSLWHLEDLWLEKCCNLDRIIEASDEAESNKMVLPELKNLVLISLPELTKFSSTGSDTIVIEIECPSLEHLYVDECPQFSMSASDFHSSNQAQLNDRRHLNILYLGKQLGCTSLSKLSATAGGWPLYIFSNEERKWWRRRRRS